MLAAIFRIVALVRKELLAMLKDPRGRAVLFVPPVLQCIVFGYVVNYDLTRVSYVAFDRDRSAASSELLASLDGSGVFQRVANLERAADVKTMIDERRVLAAVEMDQDFERRLLSGQSADVQVIIAARNPDRSQPQPGRVARRSWSSRPRRVRDLQPVGTRPNRPTRRAARMRRRCGHDRRLHRKLGSNRSSRHTRTRCTVVPAGQK